jgi:hypothetical protein
VAAVAAAIVQKAARRSDAAGLAAQALALRDRLLEAAEASDERYRAALDATAGQVGPRIDATVAPLMTIVTAARDVADLAVAVGRVAAPEALLDVAGAAELAAGAAATAARLVEGNLVVATGDARADAVRHAARQATAAAQSIVVE